MKTLFIDTHMDIHIALLDNDQVINEECITDKNQNSTYLMNTLKKVVGNNSYDEIIVVNGPGSFTGVRLGVTIAKTLAYTLNIPIKTITYLELLAINNEYDSDKYVAFNDKKGYFIGHFNFDNELIDDYEYVNNSEFSTINENNKVFTDMDNNFSNLILFMKNKEAVNPHLVNPIYVKRIEVEK